MGHVYPASLDESIKHAAEFVIKQVSADLETNGGQWVVVPFAPPGIRAIGTCAAVLEDGARYACGIRIGPVHAALELEYVIDVHKADGLPEVPHPDGLPAHKHWSIQIGGDDISIGNVLVNYTADDEELQRMAHAISRKIATLQTRDTRVHG